MIWNLYLRCRILRKFAIVLQYSQMSKVLSCKGLNEKRNFDIVHIE